MKKLLIILAKEPKLGHVKTRLAKSIGDPAALWVYQKLLDKTLEVSKNNQWKSAIFFYPKPHNPNLYQHLVDYSIVQVGATFGQRIKNTALWGFENEFKPVVVICSDLWDIHQETIELAFKSLEHSEFVIGPATDGGYNLIGMNFFYSPMFENITWSTDKVLQQTLDKLKDYPIEILEKKPDIDFFEDLKNEPELYQLYLEEFQ